MRESESGYRVVLVLAGHDPSGAAGLQADIETVTAHGCRCVSVITSLTAQNTSAFAALTPQSVAQFEQQYNLLLDDISVDACKIGLIGDLGLAESICRLLDRIPGIPRVLDPVMQSGTGTALADPALREFMACELLKKVDVCTPNTSEARLLAGLDDTHSAGSKLVGAGCPNVLVTGADNADIVVKNILFQGSTEPVQFEWERLPGNYHGSGCTLASAIASQLATGADVMSAVTSAQEYTWQALKHAARIGTDQLHPDRFWSR